MAATLDTEPLLVVLKNRYQHLTVEEGFIPGIYMFAPPHDTSAPIAAYDTVVGMAYLISGHTMQLAMEDPGFLANLDRIIDHLCPRNAGYC